MIDILKEKSFSLRDVKNKTSVGFELNKTVKISTGILAKRVNPYDFTIFLGISNGKIMSLKFSKQKTLLQKFLETNTFTCPDEFKHKGNINVLTNEIIEGNSVLFSGGSDNLIKIWNTDIDDTRINYYVKTLFGHKGAILSIVFNKNKSILVSSATDKTIRVWKLDENFDKTMNPVFYLTQVIKEYFHLIVENPFWINHLSIKDGYKVELYAGDTQGFLHMYEYKEEKNKGFFVPSKSKSIHKMGLYRIVHSIYDPMVYTIGFDRHMVGYNLFNDQKNIDITNSAKTFFSSVQLNYLTQEVICGDELGGVTFVKIFNKTTSRSKAINQKILFAQSIEIQKNQELLVIISEDTVDIFSIKRETKVVNVQYHEGPIIKLFVTEPLKNDNKIIEDAKVISCSYDNKIKVWDFLSMENICLIDGPDQFNSKNIELSTMCYLPRSNLIAIGLDIGKVYFWDLKKSKYLPNVYQKYFFHTGNVRVIINAITSRDKEILLTSGYDGLIILWEIEAFELKLSNKSSEQGQIDNLKKTNKEFNSLVNKQINLTPEMIEKLNPTELNYLYKIYLSEEKTESKDNNNKSERDKDVTKEIDEDEVNKQDYDSKNFNFIPNIKLVINTRQKKQAMKLDNCDLMENYTLAYMVSKHIVYSGGQDCKIHVWNCENGDLMKTLKGHSASITCMTFDNKYLLSGSDDGLVNIWNTDDNSNLYSLKVNIDANSTTKSVFKVMPLKIVDMIMISNYGILVALGSDTKLYFWKYEAKEILKIVHIKKECTCLAIVDSYGKLLCGSKDKTIEEVDLAELLDNLGIKHTYQKFPFMNDSANYIVTEKDKEINNFKVMNSLTKDLFDF